MKDINFSPLIKWPGSKRKVASELVKLTVPCDTYFEPFLGGGAMLPHRKSISAVGNDIIPELIGIWNMVKNDRCLVEFEYKKRWDKLQKEGHDTFYEIRENFNATRNPMDFLFLSRTCVNGLIRFNKNGDFNNSMHKNRPGINPILFSKIIKQWNENIQNVEFSSLDYREVLQNSKRTDFIFLDPPYGGTKDRYKKLEFNLTDFYNELEKLNNKGVKWMLTFDGNAGNRVYEYEIPKEVYRFKKTIQTGNSPFTKLMKTGVDIVNESVYLNYEPTPLACF